MCEEGYEVVIGKLEEGLKDFIAQPSKFSILSDDHIRNYVAIREG